MSDTSKTASSSGLRDLSSIAWRIASIRAPYLLLLLALVYFGSRAYYRARFGLSYPGAGTP